MTMAMVPDIGVAPCSGAPVQLDVCSTCVDDGEVFHDPDNDVAGFQVGNADWLPHLLKKEHKTFAIGAVRVR